MSQLTYLQIVNKVLTKLREDTVTSVTYNDYSALIGEFVNDAKKEVENAWNWRVLDTATTFTSVVNTVAYNIGSGGVGGGTPTNNESRLLFDEYGRAMAFDLTPGAQLRLNYISLEARNSNLQLNDAANITIDQPVDFSLTTDGGGLFVSFKERPTVARNYLLYFTTPQSELSNGTDTLLVPWRPVMHLAHLYALDERGEEIGEPGSKAWMRYEKCLSDEIALDNRLVNKSFFSVN